MNSAITIMSHPNASFAGARDLRTAQDGILLAVSRTPLHCAARRLREEGVAVVDFETLQPVDLLRGRVLVAVAASFGATRLIDNILLDIPRSSGDTP